MCRGIIRGNLARGGSDRDFPSGYPELEYKEGGEGRGEGRGREGAACYVPPCGADCDGYLCINF